MTKGMLLVAGSMLAIAAAEPVAAQTSATPGPVTPQSTVPGSPSTTPNPASADEGAAPTGAAANPGETPGGADIVVTGSRIARSDYVAQSPIVTTNQAAIENAGVATIDAALVQLPQFQPGSGGFSNQNDGGGGVGQATLNLRGLGAQRTLVLLDGRRYQPSNAQGVIDTNTIPSSAIGNVEVISGGASATYGSDALAGVVNFKLRRGFEGLELNGQMGITDKGDGATRQLSFLAGHKFAGGAGSIMVAGEYADRDAIGYRDRDVSRVTGALSNTLRNGFYNPSGTNLPTQAAYNAAFTSYGFASGLVPRTAGLGVNNDGTLFRSSAPGTNYKPTGDLCTLTTSTPFGNDGYCYAYLQIPLERYNGLVRADYEISPAATVYFQGSYTHSRAFSRGSEPPFTPPASGIDIPVTNPFIPAALRAVLASRPSPTAPFAYVKRLSFDGPRTYQAEADVFQLLGGVNGRIGGDWNYDLYASYGETRNTDTTIGGALSVSAVRRLVNAADGGNSLCAGGLNLFGDQPVSAACAEYIRRRPVNDTRVRQTEVVGTLSGTLLELPAGPLKAAFSADYRRNSYAFDPDPLFVAADIAAVTATQRTTGAVTVGEASAELLVPLIHNTPLIQSLNVTLGYRYSHYKPSGGISTYKADFDWRVVEPLLLRGSYQRAVRAPNVGELFQAPGVGLIQLGSPPLGGDPCDARSAYRTGANGTQVRALCIATGVPAAVVDTFNQISVAATATTQGNPDLTPETSDSFTVGAVFQPKFLGSVFSRMSLSVDYYDIKIRDTISPLSVVISLQKCFNGDGSNASYAASNYYCSLFQRNASSGQFDVASQPFLNLGGYRTAGIDIQFDWRITADDVGLDAGYGALTINSVVNYLDKFEIQTLPGSPFQDFAGTISRTDSYSRWKSVTSLFYDIGAFQIGGRWRHIGSFRDSSTVTNPLSTAPGTPAYDYFDLNARLRVSDRFELRGGVTNVGDREPTAVGGVVGVSNYGTYDPVGRTIFVGFKARF